MAFVSARDLNRDFYQEAVRPFLDGGGGISHAAGLLGWGSDVLGYDTERSTDHGWGPRLCVFVDDGDLVAARVRIHQNLPDTFRGHPVRFGIDGVPADHHVTVDTLPRWLLGHLGVDASRPLSTVDWLLLSQQQVLGVLSGPVYADDGRLAPVRAALAWYPDEIWRWLVGCQWRRISQEEPFVQRTAEVGDALGPALVAARQVRELMRLALLLGRRHAPYMKWFGTAFAALDHRDGLDRALADVLAANDPAGREAALGTAYELVAARHNATGMTAPVDPSLRRFHSRPAMVLGADRFADACLATVTDPELRALPPIGGIDQFADSTDVLSSPAVHRLLAGVYPAPR